MAICKFCNQEKKLVKAHIIPRAFFEYIKGEGNRRGQPLKEITNTKGEYPYKDKRKGLYDSELLCAACEDTFKSLDDYAIQLFLKTEKSHIPYVKDGKLICWTIKKFDYKKLMLFFIFLLWRSGASKLKEFNRINLGPYLELAKKALVSKDLEDIDKFSIALARFSDKLGKHIFLDPHMEAKKRPFPQLNVCRFYLGAGYIAYIKVDKRSFPAAFELLKMSGNKTLIILSRTFIGSKEVPMIQKVDRDAEFLAKKLGK